MARQGHSRDESRNPREFDFARRQTEGAGAFMPLDAALQWSAFRPRPRSLTACATTFNGAGGFNPLDKSEIERPLGPGF
jgi:hypothetical protein